MQIKRVDTLALRGIRIFRIRACARFRFAQLINEPFELLKLLAFKMTTEQFFQC
ncbi:hypothetical protein D3C75_1039430 [compost metagenome]